MKIIFNDSKTPFRSTERTFLITASTFAKYKWPTVFLRLGIPLPWSCKRPNTPLYYFVMPENQQAKDFFWQAGCLKSRSLMSAKCANIKKNTIWRHFTSFLVLSHCAKIWKRCNFSKSTLLSKAFISTANTLFHKL